MLEGGSNEMKYDSRRKERKQADREENKLIVIPSTRVNFTS
jgi:hypothetical protein